MKKLFSLLTLLIFAFGISWAGSITFADLGLENGTQYTEPFDGGDFTVTFAGGSNDGKYYTTGSGIRVYGAGTMTIEAKSGNLTEITITYDGNYKPTTNDVVNVGTYANGTGVWTGSASSVVFTRPSGSGHWRVKSITVTVSGGSTTSIAAPTINVDATQTYTIGTSVPVTITNNETGATVKYSLNDGNWMDYTGEFNVTETTTIKAKAVKGSDESSTVTKTVTFVAAPTTVTTVAEFNALELDTEFTYNAALTTIGQTGQNLYAQDATGNGILIYGSVGQSYEQGAVIPSGWKAKRGEYKGTREATNPSNFSASQSTTTLVSAELAISDITLDNIGKYGYVRGVTVNGNKISDGTNEVATYTSFESVPSDVTDKTFDVRGVVGAYNGNVQFLPFEYTPVGTVTPTKHTAPVFSLDPEKSVYTVGDVVTVTITSEDNNVNIGHNYHPTEGIIANFPTAYVPISNGDSFTITASEPTTYELKAFAYGYEQGDELENSDITTINVQFIAAPDPLPEGSHMIVFNDNGNNDATSQISSDELLAYITTGAEYVASASGINKVYKGKTGLKFSTSSVAGAVTLNFAEPFTNVTKVVVSAKVYGTDTGCKINGVDVDTEDYADYEIAADATLSSLTLTATKRIYVKSINIITGEPTYSVALTPAAGTYTEPVNVTIATANAAEGSEIIMYTLDGTDPSTSNTAVEYTAPFRLTQTTTVKVYALDAEMNEATAEAEYTINLPEFTFTPSVQPGTYSGTKEITFTPSGAIGGILGEYTITFVDGSTAQTGNVEDAFTVTLDKSASVAIYAQDGLGREFDESFAYVIEAAIPVADLVFEKVTSTSGLEAGKKYIIVYNDGDAVMGPVVTATNPYCASLSEGYSVNTDGTIQLTENSEVNVVTLGGYEDAWTLTVAEGTMGYSGTKNTINIGETNNTWTIDFDDNENCVITNADVTTRIIQYNSNSNSLRFSTYSGSQQPIQLYKQVEAVEPGTEITLAELLAEGVNGTNYTVTDALTIAEVSVEGNHAYAADADGNWIRLDVGEDISRDEVLGFAVNVTGVFTGRGIAPALAVSSLGELSQGFTVQINTMRLDQELEIPMANQVVKLVGYYHADDNTLSSYSGNNPEGAAAGSDPRGQVVTLNGENAGDMNLSDGVEYEIVSAIVYKEAWTPANAPRRISSDDSNAFTNLQADVVDGSAATPTGVVNVKNAKNVMNVRYFNVAGVESSTPFDGINIVVTRYTDGTTTTSKMRK